jgi:hypothetical protein
MQSRKLPTAKLIVCVILIPLDHHNGQVGLNLKTDTACSRSEALEAPPRDRR